MGQNTMDNGLTETSKVSSTNQGTYKSKTGYVYEGEWKKNMKQGKGKMTYADGKIYEGDFIANRREGEGKSVQKTHISEQKSLPRTI